MKTTDNQTKITLIKRLLHGDPYDRTRCYDLCVSDDAGSVLLKDIATKRRTARRIARIFRKEGVDSVSAPYILEDLLSDRAFLD